MSSLHRTGQRMSLVALIAVGVSVYSKTSVAEQGGVAGGAIPQPTLDGNLHDMNMIVQMIQANGLRACAMNQMDNVNNGPNAGADGFQDEPLQDDANPLDIFMRTAINVGNTILIYVPDSDGIVFPSTEDDSWLAIGINIANGDGDIFANPPGQLGPPYIPCNIMVPFDADGNGNPCTLGTGQVSRWCFPLDPNDPDPCSPSFVPAPMCPQPVLTFDESQEAMTILFRLCANSPGDLQGIPDFDLVYSQRFAQSTMLTLGGLNPSLIQIFPPVGSACAQIRDRGLDGITFADGLGNDDFEFLIDKIDSQMLTLFPGDDYLTQTRFKLARLGLALRSDASADLSNEDSMFVLCPLDIPDIEVTKQVRCQNENSAAWREHVVTVPGSRIEFKIEVENTGNVPLLVTLHDVLSDLLPVTASVDLNLLVATLFRPSDNMAGIPVNAMNASNFGLNPTFFLPGPNGFLGGVAIDQPRELGVLQPVMACSQQTQLGDRVVLVFSVVIGDPPDLCASPQSETDIVNVISATGVPLPPSTAGPVTDAGQMIDTVRENIQGFDDNVVTVDVLCREVDLLKEVRLLPNGAFVTGLNKLDVPNGPFPLQIEYRYTVSNSGDVEEDVVLEDAFLCQDIAATAGVDFVIGQCALCQGVPPGEQGQIIDTLAPGQTKMYTCRVNFTTLTALRAFLMRDDGRPNCRALDDMGSPDPRCYRNCAEATFTADLGASCDLVPPRELESFATICNRECELLVTKGVQCILDSCGQPLPQNFGPFEDNLLQVAPGSCVRYCINVENIGLGVPMCSLRFTDLLSQQPADIMPIPGSASLLVNGTLDCPPPPCFNSTGAPCDFNPASCPAFPGGMFQPGQVISLCFNATIPQNANPAAPDPVNTVTVEGASECPVQGPVYSCMDDDSVAVDIFPASLTCSGKQWALQSDSDADCEPNGPFSAFSANIDLRDDIFPVLLRLRVQGTNTGQVPLQVTASDAALANCVNTLPDIAFIPGMCELGTSKLVLPGATADWLCDIRIETAAAARALDACDGAANGIYNNTASVSGTTVSDGTNICTQPSVTIQGTSTCSAQIQVPPPCDFTVTKNVVCVDGCPNGLPSGTPAESLNAIPGARARFDISVTNTSPLVRIPRICVADLLDCPSWLCGGSLAGSLRAMIGASNVTPDFAGFTVDGVDRCFVFDSRPAAPWIAPGETLVISFEVQLPNNATQDCVNSVSVEGFSEVCAPPPDLPCDTGSDSATIVVREPAIHCTKEVRAFNTGGLNTTFTTDLALPCNVSFPLTLEYRFTVHNGGETSLSNVRICDPDLTADAQAAGFGLAGCALAGSPDGCSTLGTLAAGATVNAICQLTVPSRAAFEIFAQLDGDPETECYHNTSTASGRASGTGLCRGVNDTVSSTCSANICLAPQCHLDVTKQVRCLDSCAAGNPVGPFQDSVQVAPGTCVEFEVNITNNSPDVSICRLRIADTLSGQPANITPQGSATFRIGGTNCTVPVGFNLNGVPFEFNPQACTGAALQPGQALRIHFRAQVPSNANPMVTPNNTVSVEGAPQCPKGVPNYCCTGSDSASVDILRPALTCNGKEWRLQWDSDANCLPNAPFSAFDSMIDLRDKVFPVLLELRVRATNDGEVPLNVTAADPTFINCVNITPGVSIVSPPTCELSAPTPKFIPPGGSATWTCQIRIDSGQAARSLDACDGTSDGVYRNTATVTGTMVTGGTSICVPPATQVMGTDDCSAQILVPPPCDLETSKDVVCISGCVNGAPQGTQMPSLQILPGGFARYVMEIKNVSPVVKIPRVCLTDVLTCASWRCAGPIRASLSSTDVSADFAGLLTNGTRQCFNITSRPAAPWIAPGETLTLTIDVQVPPDFVVPGGNPDCQNTVTSEGYSEVCPDQPPLLPSNPCRSTDSASMDVRVSKLTCDKRVSIDIGADGTIEYNNVSPASIDSSTFPIRLTYKFGAINGGETTLDNICIVDPLLLQHATAAGVVVGPCALSRNATCSGAGSVGGLIGTLAPGASSNLESVTCELLFQTEQQWQAFGASDLPRNGSDCYENIATATGSIRTTNLCVGAGATTVSSGQCSVEVCVSGANPCPVTKAKFDIWNENEVRFSGTERCIISWDERYLSNYTEIGHPNHFLRSALQTNKGKARIDGLRSPVVCGTESIPAPLLGVAVKRMTFSSSQVESAGTTISGAGIEPGKIRYQIPLPPKQATEDDRPYPYYSTGGDGPSLPPPLPVPPIGVDPAEDPQRVAEDFLVATNPISGVSQKGSLLVYPKVELKWDATNTLIQDTFVTIANDTDAGARVQLYFVNGDQPTAPIFQGDPPVIIERAHPGCNWVDNQIALTNDEAAHWSTRTGLPKGVSPLTILDPGIVPGRPDDDPHNPGGRVLRGYILAWAINIDSHEIRWNHLTGSATIVNYADTSAWTYSAWAFQSVADVPQGAVLLNPLGTLDLDGLEYEYPPSTLVFDFYSSGAVLASQPGVSILIDTDLTLWVAIKDFIDVLGL